MTTPTFWSAALRSATLCVALCSFLAACSSGSGDAPPQSAAPGTTFTASVSGKVVAPDGTTPIANALVYVENSTGTGSVTLSCGTLPNANWAYTCSASDGSFSFSGQLPPNAKITAVKGSFKIEIPLGTPVNGVITQGNVAFSTSGTNAAQMAVVTGSFDSVQDILARLGFGVVEAGKLKLGTEKFKLYQGDGTLGAGYESSDKLFVDADGDGKADIFKYSIVFWNCGTDESIPLTTANKAILRQYVQGGGRLYVSDLAYDIVEQIFPEYIDFYGSDSTAANTAEVLGDAEVGDSGIIVNATVDPALVAWLRSVSCAGGSCVQADGTVKIDGFLSGWGVINGAHSGATSVKTWLGGTVTYNGGTSANKPLTMSFSVGSGRVTYTSYHNEDSVSGELQPQQRILQYLVFEL